jgi:hypothetical protein
MKHLNGKVSIVAIFFAATALLVFYLLSIRWQIYLPIALFWIAVASMLGTITYQILRGELLSSDVKLVLLEIAVTCFVFHLIYVIPYYGLPGFDPYTDMGSAKGILSSGFVLGDPKYINYTSNFPMIHILGAILSMITGIDIFSVAKWFSPLVGVAVIPLLYLLVRCIFKEEKVALLSALLFACLQNQISFISGFIRETLALVLAVCCLYLYFSAKHSPHPATNYALSIMCLIATVFAHHLTSFMLLIFLSIHFLVTKMSEVPSLRRTYFGDKIMGEKVTTAFLSIALVATLAYWTYVIIYPLYTLVTFVRDVFTPVQWGVGTYAEIAGISAASIRTIRGYIIFYGFYSFLLIFGLILLYGLLPRAKNRRVETYSFSLFLLFCGLIGFLSLYVLAPAAFPDRFLTYGWLFGFVPLVAAILKGKYKWLRRIGVLLLVAFMLFNIYMVATPYWNPTREDPPANPSLEYYALANTFNFSTGKILASSNPGLAIYDVHNNLGTFFSYSSGVNLTQFAWVIIEKKELALEKSYYPGPSTGTIAVLEHLVSECPVGYNKIYESDNLIAIKVRSGS